MSNGARKILFAKNTTHDTNTHKKLHISIIPYAYSMNLWISSHTSLPFLGNRKAKGEEFKRDSEGAVNA